MDIRGFFNGAASQKKLNRKRKTPDSASSSNPTATKKKKLTIKGDNKPESEDAFFATKHGDLKKDKKENTNTSNFNKDTKNDAKTKPAKTKTTKGEDKAETKTMEDDNDGDEDYVQVESSEDENEHMEDDEDDDFNPNTNSNTNSNAFLKTKIGSPTKNKLSNLKKVSLKQASAYEVIDDAGFTADKDMPYKVIAEVFDELSKTTKRLEKTALIANLLRSVFILRPEELVAVVYLCSNTIAPPYHGIELGIGDQIILKALCDTCGRQLRDMKKDLIRLGDLGEVAQTSRSKQRTMFKPKPLTVKFVFNQLRKVATTSGNKSQAEKVRLIQRLFVSASGCEPKYIVRHLQGKMRIGVNEQTVLAALGLASAFTPAFQKPSKTKGKTKGSTNKILDVSRGKSVEEMHELELEMTAIVKQVVSELPNYDMVIPNLIKYPIHSLHKHCHLTAGIPIKVMLAKPTKGVEEILSRFSNIRFTLEYKYDGERAQIHLLPNGEIKIFSRNAEDNTEKFPDLVNNMRKYLHPDVTSFILDSEVVAYDRIEKKILPFQQLTTRKRKGVSEEEINVQVCIYAFDCLLINNEPLIQKPFSVRRDQYLHKMFVKTEGKFQFAHFKDTADADEIAEFLNQAVEDFCEGLMVKTLEGQESTYEPSKRSVNWLKCKKDYLDGVGDTLDLCVMGAFHGSGKRTGYYGSFLVGCYCLESETWQSCCKLGTGLKDADLARVTAELKPILVEKKPFEYETGMDCEVWFEPKFVWEVKCADLTISPVHSAGFGLAHESKGIGLRFPRYLRNRDDKKSELATSSQQIYEMYQNQAQIANQESTGSKRFR